MKALIGLLAVVCLLTSAVGAQETVGNVGYPALNEISYSYYGGSARTMAMGYANVGLANDVSGGLWNPAGLYILDDVQMSASYNYFDPTGTFTHSLMNSPVENNLDMNAIGHFSFAAPVRIKGHPFVFNFNFDRRNEYAVETGVDVGAVRIGQEDHGYLHVFNFGGSTRIYKQFSGGFLVNIHNARRTIEYESVFTRDTIVDFLNNIVQTKVTTDGLLDSTTSNGVNFTAGFMLKQEKFSVGTTIHSPFTMKHNTDRRIDTTTITGGLQDINDSRTIYVLDSLAKQDIPLTVAFGIGIYPTEKLTMALDVNYQNYGSTDWYYLSSFLIDAGGDRNDEYSEVFIGWNNTFGIGGGIEYVLDTDFGRIPVRGGFRFDQLPQPKEFNISYTNFEVDGEGNPVELDELKVKRVADGRQNQYSFSLGTGIGWSQIRLDFAYRYTTGAETSVTESIALFDEDTPGVLYTDSQSANYENSSHELRFTFTGNF